MQFIRFIDVLHGFILYLLAYFATIIIVFAHRQKTISRDYTTLIKNQDFYFVALLIFFIWYNCARILQKITSTINSIGVLTTIAKSVEGVFERVGA
ncbi:MAG: hypothetical protein CR975_06140 [Gammaproteobacteria bacterium]|nr:MAG: hypothetical protein CR975_06140 [Gammaproteobacteria bacterium]